MSRSAISKFIVPTLGLTFVALVVVSFKLYTTTRELDELVSERDQQTRQATITTHHIDVCWKQLAVYRGLPRDTVPDDIVFEDVQNKVEGLDVPLAILAYDNFLVHYCTQERLAAKVPPNPEDEWDFSKYVVKFEER